MRFSHKPKTFWAFCAKKSHDSKSRITLGMSLLFFDLSKTRSLWENDGCRRKKYLEERSIFHFPRNTKRKEIIPQEIAEYVDESPEKNGIVEPSNLKRFNKWAKEKTVLYISSDDFAIAAQFQFFFSVIWEFFRAPINKGNVERRERAAEKRILTHWKREKKILRG